MFASCWNRLPIYLFINLIIFSNVYRYNDHHFHYGYHISAAAIVAKHRPQWGVKYFERILLYVRDIANPSADDEFFPMYRQKDWYLGNSYAAGLVSSELLLFPTLHKNVILCNQHFSL